MNSRYEMVVCFDPDLDEAALKVQIEKIEAVVKAHSGAIESKDVWGKRALAYPIKKKNFGSFVLLIANGDTTLIAELRRQLRINDQVLRFMLTKKDKFSPDFVNRVREEGPGGDDRREGFSRDGFGGDMSSDYSR